MRVEFFGVGHEVRELIKRVEADGWRMVQQTGSNRQYKHETKKGRVTIAGKPGRDVPKEYSQAGWTGVDMREYTVVYERADDGGWGAYAPDLPGLGVVGDTLEEAQTLIREGIVLHVNGLMEDGLPVPEPAAWAQRIAVPA